MVRCRVRKRNEVTESRRHRIIDPVLYVVRAYTSARGVTTQITGLRPVTWNSENSRPQIRCICLRQLMRSQRSLAWFVMSVPPTFFIVRLPFWCRCTAICMFVPLSVQLITS